MSAFVVSHDHIDALLTYAIQHRVSYWDAAAKTREDITEDNATLIGRILLAENERSVETRYPSGELPGKAGEDAASYSYRMFDITRLNAVTILKACQCFDYQACENDDYDESLAWRIIADIRNYAIHDVPGYRDADGWNIERRPSDFNLIRLA